MALSDAASGVQGAVQQILLRRMQEEAIARQVQQQQFQNQQSLAQSARADEGLGLQRQGLEFNQARAVAQDTQRAEDLEASKTNASEKTAEMGRYLGTLPPALRARAEAQQHGLTGVTQHDFETPEEHTGHLKADDDAKRAADISEYETKKRLDAQYREPAKPEKERVVQIAGPDGQPIYVRESDAIGKGAVRSPAAAKPTTGVEKQALVFYNAAKQATDNIAPIEDKIAHYGTLSQAQLQNAPNFMQTQEQQTYRQAQRAFTEARLRKVSGAAIGKDEYENDAKTYFAQVGDKPATLELKRKARNQVINGLKFESGKAYDEYYGDQPEQAAPSSGVKITKITRLP